MSCDGTKEMKDIELKRVNIGNLEREDIGYSGCVWLRKVLFHTEEEARTVFWSQRKIMDRTTLA